MIKFEEYLVNKGYEQFAFSFDKGYYKPKTYIISTLVNLGHIYINSDKEHKIVIGLHEKNKPVTLISPRPRIEVKRLIDDKVVIFNEWYDDEMNVVLSKVDFDLIYKAMFDKDIIIKVDLTK
jgi:hypothetical protein